MRLSEVCVCLGFLAFVVTIYIDAGRIIVLWAYGRITGHNRLSPRFRWVRRVILAAAAGGLLCFVYAWQIEPYHLTVTHLSIPSAKLTPGSKPIRIVHVSDTHCDATARLEDRVAEEAGAQKPDLILFTGDAVNSPDGVENFRRCMTALAKVAPTYAVRGNWDYDPWDEGIYKGTGVRELYGASINLLIAGHPVWLAGCDPGVDSQRGRLLGNTPHRPLTIFLEHYPDDIYEVAKGGIDLYLAGHTHGGQVCLPFYGAMVTLSSYGKRFEYGRSVVDSTTLFVTRGIGMEGHITPRVRFLAPPELVVIEIVPAGDAAR